MAATPENLQVLANYLTQTLSGKYDVRKPAEEYLISLEGAQGFTMLLLQLAESEQVDLTVRLAAAINFKNVVKRNWRIIDEHDNKVGVFCGDCVECGYNTGSCRYQLETGR